MEGRGQEGEKGSKVGDERTGGAKGGERERKVEEGEGETPALEPQVCRVGQNLALNIFARRLLKASSARQQYGILLLDPRLHSQPGVKTNHLFTGGEQTSVTKATPDGRIQGV